jgi:hypothetical protein
MCPTEQGGMDDRFKDSFVVFHGPLLPFELMIGLLSACVVARPAVLAGD